MPTSAHRVRAESVRYEEATERPHRHDGRVTLIHRVSKHPSAKRDRRCNPALAIAIMAFCFCLAPAARAQLSGELAAHDPSTLIKDGTKDYYFATGPGI